jgi:hypothetical protein
MNPDSNTAEDIALNFSGDVGAAMKFWMHQINVNKSFQKRPSRLARARERQRWFHMMRRCYNPKDQAYKNYGGRGILVCQKWHSFDEFFKDMGPVPSEDVSMDRIDNNKGYEPGNVRWATCKDQAANKRKSAPTPKTKTALGTITKIGAKWRALVRLRGHKSHCKTFLSESEARSWAAETCQELLG